MFDESCNCYVEGKVKYLVDCKTAVLVDYGNGSCDNIATKTICIKGKCETSSGAYQEDFALKCTSANFSEGPISDEEANEIGI